MRLFDHYSVTVTFGHTYSGARQKGFNPVLEASAWLPVPLMALTLFVIVASQMSKLSSYADTIVKVIPIYLAFMIIMPVITRLIVKYFSLDIRSGRAVVFSAGTRNSLVVLPLALSLPDQWSSLVAAIIVTQTIVELVGELIYIRLVPRFVLPDKSLEQNSG